MLDQVGAAALEAGVEELDPVADARGLAEQRIARVGGSLDDDGLEVVPRGTVQIDHHSAESEACLHRARDGAQHGLNLIRRPLHSPLIGEFAMITRVERSRQVRRRRLTVVAGAAAAFVLGLIVGAGGDEPDPSRPAAESPAEPGAQATPDAAPVERLSLEQQVGRMVILRFAGTRAPEYVTRNLREGKAAGVILFRDNVTDPDQLRALTRSLHDASRDSRPSSASTRRAARSASCPGPSRSGPRPSSRPSGRCARTRWPPRAICARPA